MKITIEIPDEFVADLDAATFPDFLNADNGSLTVEERLKLQWENQVDQQVISRRVNDASEDARKEVTDARNKLRDAVSSAPVKASAVKP